MKELLQNLVKLQEFEFSETSDGKSEAAISVLRRKIPLPILEHYDRLTARGKTGIAPVRHHVCMGCHMHVPIGAIITLMHASDIQMCENCGRYLYLLPADAAEVETPPPAVAPKRTRKPRVAKRSPNPA